MLFQVQPPLDDVDVKIKQEFQDDYASCQAAQGPLPQLSPGGTTLLQPQPLPTSQNPLPSQQHQQHTLPPVFPGNHMAPYPNLQMSQCSSMGYEPAPAIDVKPQISPTSQLAHMSTISPTALPTALPTVLPTQSQTSVYHHSQFTPPHNQGLMMNATSANMSYHNIPDPLAQTELSGTLPGVHQGHTSMMPLEQMPGLHVPIIPMTGQTGGDDSLPVPIISEEVLEMQRAMILAYEELSVVTKRVSGVLVFVSRFTHQIGSIGKSHFLIMPVQLYQTKYF